MQASAAQKVPCFTNMSGARSAAQAIAAPKAGNLEVHPLQ